MKKLFLLLLLALSAIGCTVQERIVFDEGMGGSYTTRFDLSDMMTVVSQSRPKSSEKPLKKMDTLVVFDDLLETYKDSIATLPAEKQADLARLKGMTMKMNMDEENNVFEFSAAKNFNNFEGVANVSEQMEEVFNLAKEQGVGAKTAGPGSDMLKTDKVVYQFDGTTFSRIDKESMASKTDSDDNPETAGEDAMMNAMLGEFDDLLKKSKLTLSYTFPRPIQSVSHEEAVISEDRKTVTYSVDWKTLMDDKSIPQSFEVELEQE